MPDNGDDWMDRIEIKFNGRLIGSLSQPRTPDNVVHLGRQRRQALIIAALNHLVDAEDALTEALPERTLEGREVFDAWIDRFNVAKPRREILKYAEGFARKEHEE
jgi:hypothetical protein